MTKELNTPSHATLRDKWLIDIDEIITEMKDEFYKAKRPERRQKIGHSMGYLMQVGSGMIKDAESEKEKGNSKEEQKPVDLNAFLWKTLIDWEDEGKMRHDIFIEPEIQDMFDKIKRRPELAGIKH